MASKNNSKPKSQGGQCGGAVRMPEIGRAHV